MYTEIIDNKRVLKENLEIDLWEELADFLEECHFTIKERLPLLVLSQLDHIYVSGMCNPSHRTLSIFLNNNDKEVLRAKSTSSLWVVKLNETEQGFYTDRQLADLLLRTIREEWSSR